MSDTGRERAFGRPKRGQADRPPKTQSTWPAAPTTRHGTPQPNRVDRHLQRLDFYARLTFFDRFEHPPQRRVPLGFRNPSSARVRQLRPEFRSVAQIIHTRTHVHTHIHTYKGTATRMYKQASTLMDCLFNRCSRGILIVEYSDEEQHVWSASVAARVGVRCVHTTAASNWGNGPPKETN